MWSLLIIRFVLLNKRLPFSQVLDLLCFFKEAIQQREGSRSEVLVEGGAATKTLKQVELDLIVTLGYVVMLLKEVVRGSRVHACEGSSNNVAKEGLCAVICRGYHACCSIH